MPNRCRMMSSKSSQTDTNCDSFRSRERATVSSALGTSGRQATGITCTSGGARPAGQPGRPATGCRDHSVAGAWPAVG